MTQEPNIVFEDNEIIVVDKPAGMPSVSLNEDETGTVAAWLFKKFPEQRNVSLNLLEAGLVNRLDNETSGLIIAARTKESLAELRRQFKEDGVRKHYLALVMGVPPDRGIIDAPIAHHPSKAKKMVACETAERAASLSARPAHTSFEVVERFRTDHSEYALLSVMIKTGMRHQIRVHLASFGFPISGDKVYRNPKKKAQDMLSPLRHMLHSARLTILHPASGEIMTFESPLPDDFTAVLARLSPKKGH